jgi:hypothetical protein
MNGEGFNRKVLCDIARCAFEVVNRLLSRDRLLAQELRSPVTGSHQIYREECITVEMAATLRERFPENVDITLFTPPEERRTGADWYWRFEREDRAIHAGVQAKRVQRTEFDQADDRGRIDIDIPQLNQLIETTSILTNELPGLQAWLATYAQFLATPPCFEIDLRNCDHHRHPEMCASHEPSLWIARAQEIREFGRQRASVREIIEHSVRLDCMLPCSDGPAAEYGPAVKGFVLQEGLPTYQECVAIIANDARLRTEFEGALRIAV